MHGIWLVAYLVQWLALFAIGIIVLAALRQIGILHERVRPRGAMADEALPPGTRLPLATMATADGRVVDLRGSSDRYLIILVASTSCSLCAAAVEPFNAVARDYANQLSALIVLAASPTEAAPWIDAHRVRMPVANHPDAIALLGVPFTPFMLAVDEGGVVLASGLVNSAEQIESLAAAAVDATQRPSATETASQLMTQNAVVPTFRDL